MLGFLDPKLAVGTQRCSDWAARSPEDRDWGSVAVSRMFDWNNQDQVGDTIWGESNENEDHIVPYSKDSEDNTVFTFGDYQKKQKNDDADANGGSTEQTSGVKNEFPGGSLENCSSFNTDEELSAPGLDLDAWPDLPCLNVELSKGYTDASDHDSLLPEKVTVQLDGEHELLGNDKEDKESNNFLDCDWSNIGDFDDLDRIFRNDPIFGHDMVADVDDFLSQSTDVIGSTAQTIPLPDLPASREQAPNQDCSSNQLTEHSGIEIKPEVKQAGNRNVDTTEKTIHQDQLSEKEDRKKKLLKSRKKAEERSKNKALQNLNGSWPQSISQQFQNPVVQPSFTSPLHGFRPPAISQQRSTGGAESTGHLVCSNQVMFSPYGYPPYPFPGIPVVSHAQAEEKHRKTVAVGRKFDPDSLEHSNISNKIPELQSRQLSMTPQEKIEKLRRRQQKQAMLAIQQQQQQFSHQMTGTETMKSQGSQKNQTPDAVTNNMGVEENQLKLPSSDMNILMDYDESQNISALVDDNSLGETIYYQLQEALRQVDIRVRLCIRDSLFRLAQSSMERQSANDRSSTNKSARDDEDFLGNEEKKLEQSHTSLSDAETYTNPIDRTVAHLLFHRPSEQSIKPVKNETPQSPISNYKLPPNIHGSISEEQTESYGEMEVQASPQK